MDTKKTGQFLAQLRRERSLTQEQLGERLGVTNKTVSRWENGNYLPPVEMLQALSEYYDVSINEILSGGRLSEQDYRERAEENIKTALESSAFSLQERIDFFRRKWKREHIGLFIFGILVAASFYIAGAVLKNDLHLLGFLWCTGFLIVENNRMMAYVEEHAFDGSGRQ